MYYFKRWIFERINSRQPELALIRTRVITHATLDTHTIAHLDKSLNA